MRRCSLFAILFASTTIVLAPQQTDAQESQQDSRSYLIAVGGGTLTSPNSDHTFGLGTIRVGRSLNRYIIVEGLVGYANATTTTFDLTTFATRRVRTPLTHADLALEAQIPRTVAPYLGVAVGRYHVSGAREVRSDNGVGVSAAGGARAYVARSAFLQAEFRVRQDEVNLRHATIVEATLGLGGRF